MRSMILTRTSQSEQHGASSEGRARCSEVRTPCVRHHEITEEVTRGEIIAIVPSRAPGASLSPFSLK
jgi:hypothetical protein